VTAVVDDWASTHATLQLWSRASDGAAWTRSGEPWPAVIGSAGAAWGDGLHGHGPPDGREGPSKHEGDRKSPAGSFALRGVYGYAPAAPGGKMPYTSVDDRWQCVDDGASTHYTQIVDRSATAVDWKSSEQMHRPDELYTWVVDVAHNPDRRSGGGSCIFLHVWHGPESSTVGCTAMAEPQLATLIGHLDPGASPVFVLLTRRDYAALAGSWGLPPL
jgi:D-alanyl-D-alanine dipeptidase